MVLKIFSPAMLALGVLTSAQAQDLLAPVASAPTGTDPLTRFDSTDAQNFLDGLSYGLGTFWTYDSNIYDGSGTPLSPIENDFILTLAPFVDYQKPAGDLTFGGRFAPNYNLYFDNSDLSGLGYDASANVGYSGGKFTFRGTFSSSLSQGANRNFNNAFVETLTFNTGLSAAWVVSPKTSIDSRFNYSWTEPDGQVFNTTETTDFDVAALWKMTPLVTLGPGVAWSSTGGSGQADLTSIGPIIRMTYKLSDKVAMDGTFGMEFYDQPTGSNSDSTFTTRFGATYQASSLWGMNLSVYKGTDANGAIGGGFQDTTSFRLGYNRKVRRAQWAMGLGYETSETIGGLAGGVGSERDYLNFDTSLGMRIIKQRVNAAIFYSYRTQSATFQDFDGHRFGLSLSSTF